jgi:uncharacterized membrane protein (DUF2068 family)
MQSKPQPPTVKGRSLGFAALVAIQVLVGAVHLAFGIWMFFARTNAAFFSGSHFASDIYSVYTIAFSVLTIAFSFGLWLQRRWGWFGTVAVLLFVIVADVLTLLNLPSVPGIPKFAGAGEITYGVLVVVYLLHTKRRFNFRQPFKKAT